MADSREEINEIFRFLAETALRERPCGENHTLSSFFLKLLEHNAPPKGFTKVVDLSDASYGDQIIKPYLEPLKSNLFREVAHSNKSWYRKWKRVKKSYSVFVQNIHTMQIKVMNCHSRVVI